MVETVKVYDGLTFSELFCLEEMRKQYAENTIDRLKAYVESDATAKFSIINIPSIDKEKLEIFITEDQVPILAALLENKVIERILDKSIRVPYFE